MQRQVEEKKTDKMETEDNQRAERSEEKDIRQQR